MEMTFNAIKWVPFDSDTDNPLVKYKQQICIRFTGNKASLDRLLWFLEKAGYEIS